MNNLPNSDKLTPLPKIVCDHVSYFVVEVGLRAIAGKLV